MLEVQTISEVEKTDRLTSSADSAKKKPWVLDSMMNVGPGLMATELSAPLSPRPSTAISNSLSLLKHNLQRHSEAPANRSSV